MGSGPIRALVKRSTWWLFAVATLIPATMYFLLEPTSMTKLVLYNGIGLSAVIAVSVGVRRNRPENARAWKFIRAGLVSFLCADIVYYILESTSEVVPFPSIADAFYLGMYPLVIWGMLLLVREASPGRDWASLVDAGIVACGTFTVLGILVMDAYLSDPTTELAGRLISLAYPVMDVALIAVAVRLIGVVHLRHPSYALMAAGLCSLLVADTIYGVLNSAGTFATGGFADAFWLGFYVLLGAAALHPAVARPAHRGAITSGQLSRTRLVVLCLVTITVPAIDLLWGEPFDKVLTATMSMVMFLLVLSRLMGLMSLVQDNERRARHDALHDSLTGLANRVLFTDSVTRFVTASDEGVVSVLFVDLDDFKTVNDSLGHQAGDALLITVAERLESCIRGRDLVARLSGDEFAVLLESAVDKQDAMAVAQRIQDALAVPIAVSGREVIISASVGIAVEPRADVHRPDVLLQAADVAMYRAKHKGKGRFEFFEREMYEEAVDRLDLKSDLQVALERGQLEVYYQPIVDMTDERITSVEALIRWNHPTRGLVTPDRFIPLAEQTGLIVPIGRWVLREACFQLSRWQRAYPDTAPRGVSVNLSVRQMHDRKLIDDVFDAISDSGIDPSALVLEITESMLVDDTDRAMRVLERLKSMQVRIAIDDFGTGYSSLSYLRKYPVDTIKIDRSFVQEMDESSSSHALVRALIDLAHVLELTTVAEGIEERGEASTLATLRCDFGQGYLFSRPLPAAQLEARFAPTPAPNGAGRVRTGQLDIEVPAPESIDDLAADLGILHNDLGVPIAARTRWLSSWAALSPEWTPWPILVRDRATGRLAAAALLARREVDGMLDVVAMGHGPYANTRLPARNDRAARTLAKAIAESLQATGLDWCMEINQLPEGDAVGRMLAQRLPQSEMAAELWVPGVDLTSESGSGELVSKNMRRQLRKAMNRLATDGHSAEVQFARTEPEIRLLLPTLARIHIDRDHAADRESDLDDPSTLALWRSLILKHAESGEVEVASLRVDDSTIAFVIGFIDPPAYRVFDGHFDPSFARYSPGRIIEAAVIDRSVEDARFQELDWMAGVASEKILVTNVAWGRMRLTAASPILRPATRSSSAPPRV